MEYTVVYGKLYGPDGVPYKGAIIKFSLNEPFSFNGRYFHNSEVRAVTNKYGLFEVELPPSTWDRSGENFYNLTIVLNNSISSKVIVHESETPVNFSDLEDYKFPFERDEIIGSNC